MLWQTAAFLLLLFFCVLIMLIVYNKCFWECGIVGIVHNLIQMSAFGQNVKALKRILQFCYTVWLATVVSASLSINIVSVSAYLTDLLPRSSVVLCVYRSVGLESVLWQNGWLDPDAVWDGEWGWGMGVLDRGPDSPVGPLVSVTYFLTEMFSTRAWKVDSISIWTRCRRNLCFIGFLKTRSNLRSMLGFARNLQKCNTHFALYVR